MDAKSYSRLERSRMYPRIYLDHRSELIRIECNQHDIGAIRHFVFDEDLTGKAVKYVIGMGDGHNVTDWCTIEDDHHTVTMVIPPQITEIAGTYEGQFIILSQSEINNDFETWKAQVLAGTTPVMIESDDTPINLPTTQKAQSATLSFIFQILVYESVYKNGDYFEGNLNKLITQIQADNARIAAENEAMKARLTTLEAKTAGHDNQIQSAFENIQSVATTAATHSQTLADHTTSIEALEDEDESMDTRVTNLSTTVGTNRLHCDQEVARLEGLIADTDVGAFAQRLTNVEQKANATDGWKEQVLAGTTPVMIETEAVADDTIGSDTEVQAAAQEEEGEAENGQS